MSDVDPRLRFELLNDLEFALYHITRNRHKEELMAIITQNSMLCGNTQNEVHFRGQFYHYGKKEKIKAVINTLQASLRDRMKAYLNKVADLEKEISQTRGFFQHMMLQSDRLADYYRIVPHSLHGAMRNAGQHFPQVEGKLSDAEATAFCQENAKYLDLITRRMTYNLLGVASQ